MWDFLINRLEKTLIGAVPWSETTHHQYLTLVSVARLNFTTILHTRGRTREIACAFPFPRIQILIRYQSKAGARFGRIIVRARSRAKNQTGFTLFGAFAHWINLNCYRSDISQWNFETAVKYIRTHAVRAYNWANSLGGRKSRITSGPIVIFSQHLSRKLEKLSAWDASTCDINLKKFTIEFNAMPLFDFFAAKLGEHKSMYRPAPDTYSVSVNHWRDSFQAAVLGYWLSVSRLSHQRTLSELICRASNTP